MQPARRFLTLLALALALPAAAQDPEGIEDLPPEQRIAPGQEEPEVRIIQRGDTTITEYEAQGQVYMIKVEPAVGPSYYLYDRNGDGEWDDRFSELGPDITVPQWTIFEW
ncbi:hypothetical protein AN478_01690 [Thiohalorhabdus denitrificans]|uniref:DUF2782 domain-containing protein n=1 Tax=Thiohalorhabdus denitrificans TaxID=381306 RepID=A0A0P9C8M1_9GAMM|nr:DUF2782 domain-containing protein [Thiohalorhabdus denitrificans]KPV41327.1 hypothetical protein AN478_01690 [Thiohalorhabdus denitrificans]SCY23207.1 Protein of unknown function [Thiohalorhabdus denitrificans]